MGKTDLTQFYPISSTQWANLPCQHWQPDRWPTKHTIWESNPGNSERTGLA